MKILKSIAALTLFLAAMPLLAQDRNMNVTLFGSQVETEESDDLGDGFATDFEDGSGFGLVASSNFGRFLSVETGVFSLRTDAGLLFEDEAAFDLGRLNLVPVMLGADGHLRVWKLDIYGGGGAAYVMANDLTSENLDVVGLGRIEVDNELTYYLNAGVGLQFSEGFGIVVDARQIPYEPSTRSTVTGVEQDLDLTTNILSVGLRFKF